jgi:RNA-splicing ligase RtcB
MNFVFPTKHSNFTIYSPNDKIDQFVFNQVKDLANLDVYQNAKIKLMPDFHAGYSSIIGLTMNIDTAITPNILGIDIGCAVILRKIKLTKVLDYGYLDKIIRLHVPSGYEHHHRNYDKQENEHLLEYIINLFMPISCFVVHDFKYVTNQLGTLGGGNHFIEIDKDDDDQYYLMVHTGSRNIGKAVAQKYQQLAIDNMDKTLLDRTTKKMFVGLKPNELAYLDKNIHTELFHNYLTDMSICQEFAKLNRLHILNKICEMMEFEYDSNEDIDTIHNYLDYDNMIIRKGAVSAKLNEKFVIPLNMKDGALICIGKGNAEWNYSAPHGSGRQLSRSKAYNTITLDQYKTSMEGVYSTCINNETLDECPLAYKNTQDIIQAIQPTAEIITHIKSVFNFKAD